MITNRRSKISRNMLLLTLSLLGLTTACVASHHSETQPDQTTPWVSLFDGESLNGWMAPNKADIGSQWRAIDGALVLTEGGGGDILTTQIFGDFELSLEWKISKKGNSGIFYRVVDDGEAVYMSGVEYQILDDGGYSDLSNESHRTASVFDMYAPSEDNLKPVGEYNHSRILVVGNHVEHWLNGKKLIEYEWNSDDWYKRLNASKFKDWKNFGKFEKGHLALQDHGNRVSYREIKVRQR